MATACILTVMAVILVWNSGSCFARPRYEYSSEQIYDSVDNGLKAYPTKSVSASKASLWSSNSRIMGFKKVVPIKWDDNPRSTVLRQSTVATPSTTHQPVLGRDRVLDQLHDHTGDKMPRHHSAIDGWVL